jgi:Icc protein
LTHAVRASDLTVLQITDVHLRAEIGERLLGIDTWDSVNAVLDQALTEARPDALLVTGDIAHDPVPEVYQRFETLIRSRYDGPVLMLPGNHDVLAAMGERAATKSLDLGAWVVLALDSHIDDAPQASVDEDEFALLKTGCMQSRDKHTLVATHHPPIDVDCPWLDKDRIQNGNELLEWMSEHSTVRAMVFGHAHQVVESSHRRIKLLGTPSTCMQFAPHTDRFALDDQPPGYRWLNLERDGGVSSTVRRVADYPMTIDLSQFRKE